MLILYVLLLRLSNRPLSHSHTGQSRLPLIADNHAEHLLVVADQELALAECQRCPGLARDLWEQAGPGQFSVALGAGGDEAEGTVLAVLDEDQMLRGLAEYLAEKALVAFRIEALLQTLIEETSGEEVNGAKDLEALTLTSCFDDPFLAKQRSFNALSIKF